MTTWTLAEVRRFEQAAADERLQIAWLLTLLGLRRGEVLGLRWQDVSVADEFGAPIPPDKYSKMFRQLSKKAGLRTIRLHDVRHTALTLMALNGVPLAVVAAWAGHADPAFTLRVYAHSQDAAIRDASSLLTRMISEAL